MDAHTGDEDGASDSGQVPDASTGPITIATGLKKPTGIALSASDVYWADETDGTISTCPKTGCGQSSPAIVVSAQARPHGIALHGSFLYWVIQGDANTPTTTYRCALSAGGGPRTCRVMDIVDLGLHAPGPVNGVGIAVSDERVYVAAGTPSIPSCPVTGCGDAGQTFLDGVSGPKFGVALGATGVYYTREFGEVGVCPLDGCKPSPTVLVHTTFPFAIAVDNERLYWSNYNPYSPGADAAIRTCPLAGCSVASSQVLAAGQLGPYAIAVDDDSIYYTDALNGRVERKPKNDFAHQCIANHLAACEACAGVVQCDGSCSASCFDGGSDGT
jgi:hypothetical protein